MLKKFAVVFLMVLSYPVLSSEDSMQAKLIDAARHGDISTVGQLLDSGADINN